MSATSDKDRAVVVVVLQNLQSVSALKKIAVFSRRHKDSWIEVYLLLLNSFASLYKLLKSREQISSKLKARSVFNPSRI